MATNTTKEVSSNSALHDLVKLARKELPKSLSPESSELRIKIAGTVKATRALTKNNDLLLRQNKSQNTRIINSELVMRDQGSDIAELVDITKKIYGEYCRGSAPDNSPDKLSQPTIDELERRAEKISKKDTYRILY